MKINSIFDAIEGEGREVGTPKTFIRMQGCTMGCVNCDTPEALSFDGGKEMTVEQIMEQVKKLKHKNITITGGNPLEQGISELSDLIIGLRKKINRYHITLEVTGCENSLAITIERLFNKVDFISFDMKSPSSKCKEQFDKSNVGWCSKAQYKIVITNWKDYKFAKEMVHKYRMCNIILTPCWQTNEEINKDFVQKLCAKVLEDNLKARIIVQQHKVIYDAKKQRV